MAKNRMSAADVTSLPVRPIPVMTAIEVSLVRSYSSRMRDRMKTFTGALWRAAPSPEDRSPRMLGLILDGLKARPGQ
jgi:hypothetical protein